MEAKAKDGSVQARAFLEKMMVGNRDILIVKVLDLLTIGFDCLGCM